MGRFSLALSGGGAAALGHIPVIEELDDADMSPVAIAGSSMGALIGACLAAGMSGRQIRDHTMDLVSDMATLGARMVRGASWSDLGAGLFLEPEHIIRVVLPEGLPERIEDLAVPFTAVATDFYQQCEARFTKGPLRPALAASMAIPGVFRPVVVDGRVYVDGGVCNNLPTEALPDDIPVIAVDAVTSPPDEKSTTVPGSLATSLGSMRIMMRALLERQLGDRPPLALVRPASSTFGPLDFRQAAEILDTAEKTRDETREAIKKVRSAA